MTYIRGNPCDVTTGGSNANQMMWGGGGGSKIGKSFCAIDFAKSKREANRGPQIKKEDKCS